MEKHTMHPIFRGNACGSIFVSQKNGKVNLFLGARDEKISDLYEIKV